MNALELTAERQSVWSATAGRLKAELDTTRWVTFGLSILGALAATIAGQLDKTLAGGSRWVGRSCWLRVLS